jgi:hypothetical protein
VYHRRSSPRHNAISEHRVVEYTTSGEGGIERPVRQYLLILINEGMSLQEVTSVMTLSSVKFKEIIFQNLG